MSDLKVVGNAKKLMLSPFEIDVVSQISANAQDSKGVGYKDFRLINSHIEFIKSIKPEAPKKPELRKINEGEKHTEEELKLYNEELKTYDETKKLFIEKEIEIEFNEVQFLFFRSKLIAFKHYAPENEEVRKKFIKLFDKFSMFE